MDSPEIADLPKRLCIFLVENHPDTLESMRLYLEMLGHTVFTADSVAGAWGSMPQANCDVLISDIGLPDGDGWMLLRLLPSPRPAYAIAMSGFGLGADRLKSQAAGYRHHLLKPIVPEQLNAALEEATRELSA